jgi:hypothetical protein
LAQSIENRFSSTIATEGRVSSLSDPADERQESAGRILEKLQVISLSSSPDLRWLGEAVLQQAGFEVFSTIDSEQALLSIEAGAFDALLLCYSLSSNIQRSVARQFHQSCPGARIVATRCKNLSDLPALADV